MKPLIFVLSLLLSLIVGNVDSVCYCPYQCENCGWPGDWVAEYGRVLCNDVESQSECDKANWEILDMQISLAALVTIFLDHALETNNMTIMQIGYARSLLSLALEDDKPEGDCANGLATETSIEGTLTHCFSSELLEQCAKVRDNVDDYQLGIARKFESYFLDTNKAYDDEISYSERSLKLGLISEDRSITHEMLKDLIEVVRFRTHIKTARIRCASFEATKKEISGAYYDSSMGFVVCAMVALTTTFYNLV
jgi:hypothetical protein